MKILLFTFLFISSTFAKSNMSFNCKRNGEQFNFNLNFDRNVIMISDKSYFKHAQLPTNKAIGMLQRNNSFIFEYNWYYTAVYQLTVPSFNKLWGFKKGDQLSIAVTYDDNDGSFEDSIDFNCLITKA